jgi:hypothetical protein
MQGLPVGAAQAWLVFLPHKLGSLVTLAVPVSLQTPCTGGAPQGVSGQPQQALPLEGVIP